MNDNISPEKGTGARAVLTTENITSVFGKKERPAIGVQKIRPGQTNETRDEAVVGNAEIYLVEKSARKRGRLTVFESLQALYEDMEKKAKQGVTLTEREMENLNGWFTKLPGVDRWDLGRYTGEMINQAAKEDPGRAEESWEEMKEADKRKKARKKNPQLAQIWDYVEIHGGDPKKINFLEVVAIGRAIEVIEKGEKVPEEVLKVLANRSGSRDKDRVFRKMREKENKEMGEEGGWKDEETKLKAYEYMLGMHQKDLQVDVQKFWKERFLEVIETRLAAMRSPAAARLEKLSWKGEDYSYLKITRAKDIRKPEHKRKYASQLAIRTVSSNTLLGGFLDEMGKGEHWRGKAYLDYLFWGMYMGQWIDNSEAMQDAKIMDIFSKLDSETIKDSEFRAFTGVDSTVKLMEDERFLDAYNELYTIGGNPKDNLSFKERLDNLATKYNGTKDAFDSDKDLPPWITDAVMLARIYADDARSLSSSDRRFRVYFFADYYLKQAMQFWDGRGKKVMEVLGYNFRLTESPRLMMGYISPHNLEAMDYHALVEDDRQFKPKLYPDQLDKVWQHLSMYCLQQRDSTLRMAIPEGGELSTLVPQGRAGEFCAYDNDRTILIEGQEKPVHDHRRAFFDRMRKTRDKDKDLVQTRGRGVVGWDDELRGNVNKAIDFLTNPIVKQEILGVEIETEGGEIFYNDKLAELLYKYEKNPTSSRFSSLNNAQKTLLENFLNMRNCLQDQRALGLVWSLDEDDPEALDRIEGRKDLMIPTLYNMSGEEVRKEMLTLLDLAPFRTLAEATVTPGQILETAKKFGQRFQNAQKYPTLHKFYLFANMVMMMRMRDLEIPSIKDLDQVINPQGEVQWGVWGTDEMLAEKGYKLKQEGFLGNYYRARMELEKELQEMGYMEKMLNQKRVLIGNGLFDSWSKAVKQNFLEEFFFERLQWTMVKSLAKSERMGTYDRLSSFHNPHEPIKSWEILEVTATELDEAGRPIRVKVDGFREQDFSETEIEKYFIGLETQEAGELFGGARRAEYLGPRVYIKTDFNPNKADPVKIKDEEAFLSSGTEIAVLEIKGNWCNVAGIHAGGNLIPLGWIQMNNVSKDIAFAKQGVEGFVRPGEVMYEGSRLVWEEVKIGGIVGKSAWRWVSEPGVWGKDSKATEISKLWSFKYDREKGFHRSLYLPGDDPADRETTYPYLVFKSETEKKEFLFSRYMQIFSFLMGRGKEFVAGGHPKIELGPDYHEEKAVMTQVFREMYWSESLMRRHERRVLARNLYRAYQNYVYGGESLAKIKETHLKAIEDMAGEARIWGNDMEALKKYEKELVPRLFKNIHKDERFIKKLFSWRLDFNEIGNWTIEKGIKLVNVEYKIGPLRINPPIVASIYGLTALKWLQLPRAIGGLAWRLFSNETAKMAMDTAISILAKSENISIYAATLKYSLFNLPPLYQGIGIGAALILGMFAGSYLSERLHLLLLRAVRPERECLKFDRPDLDYLVGESAHPRFKPVQ